MNHQAPTNLTRTIAQRLKTDALAVAALLSFERYLRKHPAVVAAFTITAFAVMGALQLWLAPEWAFLLNYTLPIAICAYGLGLAAGAAAAVVGDIFLLLGGLRHGLAGDDFASLLTLRLLTNLAVVVIAAGAAGAARARERYDKAQRRLLQTQQDLIAAFSHDLRSPLGAIIGHTELLREQIGTSTLRDTAEGLDAILTSASRVDKLIADMLSAGQGDYQTPLQVSRFDVRLLLTDLRREFSAQPLRDGVALEWTAEPNEPAMQSDRSKVTSIVRNLLSNALKFTRKGRVRVRVSYLSDADAHCIEVDDTGSGIAAEAQPHIFDRFYRVAGTRQTAGFGLGLFIVKRFVELLGGSVTVDSEVGRGTRFRVILPRLPLAGDPPPGPLPA
jgi:signal transduction histidine kinase